MDLVPRRAAALLRIKADCVPQCESNASAAKVPDKFIAMSVDCNEVYVYLDPYEGGKAAMAEWIESIPFRLTWKHKTAQPHRFEKAPPGPKSRLRNQPRQPLSGCKRG